MASALPNAGHKALARAEEQGKVGTLVTQNVDGLHQEAGSKAVIDLHGRLDQRHILIQEISLKPAR
ncbi:MAG: Sir2 family NAD-dependent protein deacetylase [Rhodoluna sp.]